MATTSLHDMASDQAHGDDEHYVWTHVFGSDARKKLLNEDVAAGRSVGAVLFTVLAFGIVLAIISVLIASA